MQAAIFVDPQALYIIHHQVRQPVVSASAVQQLHDIRMVQRGQRLPLVPEAVDDLGSVDTRPQHFDGHAFAKVLVIALAQIHHGHPAFPELADDAVCAHPSARHPVRLRG